MPRVGGAPSAAARSTGERICSSPGGAAIKHSAVAMARIGRSRRCGNRSGRRTTSPPLRQVTSLRDREDGLRVIGHPNSPGQARKTMQPDFIVGSATVIKPFEATRLPFTAEAYQPKEQQTVEQPPKNSRDVHRNISPLNANSIIY